MPVAVDGAPVGGSASLPLSRLYLIGHELGVGTFGTVHSCTRRCDGQEFAVKLIGVAVAVAVTAVRKEAQMLESLAHPNIVRFHGLLPHGAFLCIVMEKLPGGDLVEGLQTHLTKWGNIDGQNIVGAVRQMTSSIHYLHNRLVVHRDVKGDNFVMDRPDILDPECRLVLTDFGAACRLERPGERLSAVVGSPRFSAPEILDKNYSAKVDVWALGVVMYGLATGCFPFKNEAGIRYKGISIPGTVHPPFADLIGRMLRKDEAARLDCGQAVRHPYLNPDRGAWLEPATPATPVGGEHACRGEDVPAGTPRSHAMRGPGCGRSADSSRASTAEPLCGADVSLEGPGDGAWQSTPPASAAALSGCLPRCLLGLGLALARPRTVAARP